MFSLSTAIFCKAFTPLSFVTALLVYHNNIYLSIVFFEKNGAQTRNRTTDTEIFSLLLYRLSYQGKMATEKGLEPSTSSVTGWHSNQLNYRAIFLVGVTGLEPVTPCL